MSAKDPLALVRAVILWSDAMTRDVVGDERTGGTKDAGKQAADEEGLDILTECASQMEKKKDSKCRQEDWSLSKGV